MNVNASLNADIVIVGGGLVGLSQALLLAQNGFSIICLDKGRANDLKTSPHNNRTTAISYGSQQILESANIWNKISSHACAIKDIQILDGDSPVLLDLKIEENSKAEKADGFGWVIQNKYLREALMLEIKAHKNIKYKDASGVKNYKNHENYIEVILELEDETLHTALVIGADGRQSFTRQWMNVGSREWSYNQNAVVAIVTHENPHNNVAIEHFRAEGPFAILPMMDDDQNQNQHQNRHRSSIVWTEHSTNKTPLKNYSDAAFLVALNERFPALYGKVTAFENRMSYPLNFVHAYDYIKQRVALIGDAAHGIHPIAGQGLNLGLRDVACLCDVVSKAKKQNKDIGDINILNEYQSLRRTDNTKMAIATDNLNRLFSNDFAPLQLGRKIAMKFMNKTSFGKKTIISQAMGLSHKAVKK